MKGSKVLLQPVGTQKSATAGEHASRAPLTTQGEEDAGIDFKRVVIAHRRQNDNSYRNSRSLLAELRRLNSATFDTVSAVHGQCAGQPIA